MEETKQEKLTENKEKQSPESQRMDSLDTALQVAGKPLRTYKDRLFRMLFKDKEKFLELYNAMNGTINVYSALLKDEDLFSTIRIPIPYPKFVVFYNGKSPMPEKEILRLSDSYETKREEINLELKVLVLNINKGCNNELMDKCKTLREYMIYTDTVRKYSEVFTFPEAVDRAINECIDNGILKDFLVKNKAEVRSVSIFEYDEEKHMRNVRLQGEEYGREIGEEIGEKRGRKIGEEIGEKRGRAIGEKHGRAIGEKRGREIGEHMLGQLVTVLMNEGKMEEATLVASDEKVRKEYYEKYHFMDAE